MTGPIRSWEWPAPGQVGETAEDFLRALEGPTCIHLAGEDRTRTRAITTLLHGNEPSGVRALHRFLREGLRPATDVIAIVASVHAALEPPGFTHRMLPGRRDLNRCFFGPFGDAEGEDAEGALAAAILDRLRLAKPEALIDLHNTSGSGPAYAVAPHVDPVRLAMTSLFASHYVLTDIRLGALMEATAEDFPTVTIECGGARDLAAHEVAFRGMTRFFCDESVLDAGDGGREVTVLEYPLRVRMMPGAHVAYADAPARGRALTLRSDIDRFNSTVLQPSEPIGWTSGLGAMTAVDSRGVERRQELFEVRDGQLHACCPLRLFMATTNERIAEEDCIFYAIPY